MSRQAECAVTGEVLWALKVVVFLMQCVEIGQVVDLKRAVCLRLGAHDGRRVKLMSQQASLC
jgi:hypothetical protein